jgi:hypothetical protein
LDDITVKCYSGHTYAEEPRSFEWEGMEYDVEEIMREWREPGGRHFLVRVGGNKSLEICYNEANGRWSIKG